MKLAVFLMHLAVDKESCWHQKLILDIPVVSPTRQA
jgi:hypothetical protein